jgi:CMP/dCMP kinase
MTTADEGPRRQTGARLATAKWRCQKPADAASSLPHRPMIIAVDGPAASGKGTIAARLASCYGLPHLDTGLLYRAVGMGVMDARGSLDDESAAEAVALTLDASHLTDADRLTSGEAGEAASRIAGYPGVRAALLAFQKAFSAQAGGAVLDGRDIGTVIAPEAPAKLFITATPEVRATRRWKQLTARGQAIAYEDMLADIIRRDERDAGRGAAPMVQADDAVLLDTTDLSIDAAFDAARRIVEAARAKHGL